MALKISKVLKIDLIISLLPTFRSFMKETGKFWMRFPVRLRTASSEMWSSSAGRAVRWFLWTLRILRAAHDPTSYLSERTNHQFWYLNSKSNDSFTDS